MADRLAGGLARRTGIIALGQGAVKLGQVVLAVVLVRLLAPSEWNTVAHLLSIHLALVMLGTLNLQHGLLFFMPRAGRSRSRALVVQTAALIGVIAVLIAAAGAIAGAVMGDGELQVARWLPWLGLAAALELPSACAPAALIATDRITGAACWDLATAAVTMVTVVVPAAAGLGVGGIVAGLVVAGAVRAAAFAFVLVTQFEGPFVGLERGTLVRQLLYGLPLGLTIGAAVLNRSVDKWLVALWDPANIGVYAIAAQEIPLLAVLPYAAGAATAAAVANSFYTGDKSAALRTWIAQTSAMSVVVVPLSVLVVLVAPEVFAALLTPEFQAGVPAFRVFAAITLHRVAEYGLVLRAAGHTADLFRAAVVLLGANVVLAGVGAHGWGMTGASVGTLLANVIAWGYVLSRMCTVFGTGLASVFPWRIWCSAITVAGAAAVFSEVAVAWWTGVREMPPTPLVGAAMLTGVYVVAVLVGSRALGLGRHLRSDPRSVTSDDDLDGLTPAEVRT